LCFPSFAEALPVSWIEAMAYKPVANISWATDVIDGGVNGFWFIQKIMGICRKNNILLSNSQMRAEFGWLQEKSNSKFSISVVRRQSLAFYKSLIK
jgi:hypothetical protein